MTKPRPLRCPICGNVWLDHNSELARRCYRAMSEAEIRPYADPQPGAAWRKWTAPR